LAGIPYVIRTAEDGQLIAACGDSVTIPGAGDCGADFASATMGMVGGELLLAYALLPRLHLGARAWGLKSFADGFAVVGGPTASFRLVGPAWLGASFMLGTQSYRTTVTAAQGSLPPELSQQNGGATIDIPLSELSSDVTTIDTRLMVGGAVHVSAALFGSARHAIWSASMPHALLDGAVHVGLSATLLKVDRGMSLIVPVSLGYRFY
jgi:hypothetical protein